MYVYGFEMGGEAFELLLVKIVSEDVWQRKKKQHSRAERERVIGLQQFSRNEGGEEADYAILHIG